MRYWFVMFFSAFVLVLTTVTGPAFAGNLAETTDPGILSLRLRDVTIPGPIVITSELAPTAPADCSFIWGGYCARLTDTNGIMVWGGREWYSADELLMSIVHEIDGTDWYLWEWLNEHIPTGIEPVPCDRRAPCHPPAP